MDGWLRYLTLTAKARTGFSLHIVIWAAIAAVAAASMLVFLSLAGFIWLADRYDALLASLLMAGLYLVIALIAVVCLLQGRRGAIERARLELAARSEASWLDPRLMAVGLQVGRTIGWRKLASLAAVAILAAGLAKEWLGRAETPAQGDGDAEG